MISALLTAAAFAGEFLVKLVFISYILTRRTKAPSTTLAWIVIIFAVPFFGIFAYLIFGEVRLGSRRLKRYANYVEELDGPDSPLLNNPSDMARDLHPMHTPLATLAESVGGTMPRRGNDIRLFGDTDLFIQMLIDDIDEAKDHCHLLTYIFLTDHSGRRVADALIRAAQRGVACRVLVDSVGSRDMFQSELTTNMKAAGVEVVQALPANFLRMLFARVDIRNHRKIVVIDNRIGYVGSQNIADAEFAIKKRFAPWVDAMLRLQGPAVRDLQLIFVTDWYLDADESLVNMVTSVEATNEFDMAAQVLGTGPHVDNEAMHQLLLTALHTAREEIILTTPYFVPNESMVLAMRAAARRGVTVKLVVPARNDSPLVAAASRSLYEPLLEDGVVIHEFHTGLLHAKTMTVDRHLAIVGSANLDQRSFDINFEVSLVVYDTDFSSELRLLQMSYLNESTTVDPQHWNERSWVRKLVHNGAGVLGPVL